jgi:hypothetical protein
VSRGIDKRHQTLLFGFGRDRNLVGTDVLGDAAVFAFGDMGFADGIKQRGFSVVNVPEYGDNRRA